ISAADGNELAVGQLVPARETDRLVVEAQTVHVTGGPIRAALVSREGLRTESDANIEGSLIIEMYPAPKDDRPEDPWRGHVRYDPRVGAGVIGPRNDLSRAKLDRYVVSVSPRVWHKEVRWQ